MKKRIVHSIIVGALLFSGCATTSISVEKAQKNGGLREYVLHTSSALIFDDKEDKTLFLKRSAIAGNPPELIYNDIINTRDELKKYCEGIGGKWTDGNKYYMAAKHDPVRLFTTLTDNKQIAFNGLGKCEAPNNNGFKSYELGLFDYKMDWEVASGLGGGERVSWSRYYEIIYDKPEMPKKDYVLASFNKVDFFKKTGYEKINNLIEDYKGITNEGKDNYYLVATYPICKYYGGKEYIATDVGTDMKKMTMRDYMFKQYEKLYNKYGDRKERWNSFKMFPIDKKGYIWCENQNNPNKQFMLIWQDERNQFKILPYIDKKLIKSLKENKTNTPYITNTAKNDETKIEFKKKYDDKSAYNLATAVFRMKGDIKVASNPYVKYYGSYIGKIDNCEYVSVEKKSGNIDNFYNFKKCGANIEYTGKTLKGLSPAKEKRIVKYKNELERSCKQDGKALIKVDDYYLYCRAYNDNLKEFILDKDLRVIEKVK
jgi:hypothetical protein